MTMPSKRTLVLFAAACLVATSAFWAVIRPPRRVVGGEHSSSGVPVFHMMCIAPATLPVVGYDPF